MVLRSIAGDELGKRPGPLDNAWHTLRLEMKGNTIRFSIDGMRELDAADNRYLAPGRVGLLDDRIQVSVRAFRVLPL
jgi:hypothetical protein